MEGITPASSSVEPVIAFYNLSEVVLLCLDIKEAIVWSAYGGIEKRKHACRSSPLDGSPMLSRGSTGRSLRRLRTGNSLLLRPALSWPAMQSVPNYRMRSVRDRDAVRLRNIYDSPPCGQQGRRMCA